MSYRLLDRSWSLAFVLALGPLGSVACSGSADVVPTGPSQANPLDSDEQSMLAAINSLRAGDGVGQITGCATLNVSASAHSDDMRDTGYLKDVAPDGSTPRQRACEAGYQSACAETMAMAELVASGNYAADLTLDQWTKDAGTRALLVNPDLLAVGIGLSVGGDSPIWTVDFGGAVEASCSAE
jgi:uncharacterized protein YkwD